MRLCCLSRQAGSGDTSTHRLFEKRGNQFRAVFWFCGERFSCSLKTSNEREALGRLARIDDNLRQVELGLLTPPSDLDLATFLLSDGPLASGPTATAVRMLRLLLEAYFQSMPDGSIELSNVAGTQTRAKHLKRILGSNLPMQALELTHLQDYVETREKDPGVRGTSGQPGHHQEGHRHAPHCVELGGAYGIFGIST